MFKDYNGFHNHEIFIPVHLGFEKNISILHANELVLMLQWSQKSLFFQHYHNLTAHKCQLLCLPVHKQILSSIFSISPPCPLSQLCRFYVCLKDFWERSQVKRGSEVILWRAGTSAPVPQHSSNLPRLNTRLLLHGFHYLMNKGRGKDTEFASCTHVNFHLKVILTPARRECNLFLASFDASSFFVHRIEGRHFLSKGSAVLTTWQNIV